jgi:hypothetical protein
MASRLEGIGVRWLVLAALSVNVAWSASQTIHFDAIPTQIFGASPFAIAAQASSGLPVRFVSDTPQVCKTASGLVMLLSAGTCSITASQGGNAGYSAAVPVLRSFAVDLSKAAGALLAASGSPFGAGTTPVSLVVGDFNGDGFQDLATANFGSNNISVLLGNGSGGFTAAPGSPFPAGTNPNAVAVGDFNGDGFQDLATANFGDNTVTVLLGNGSGGFKAAPGSPFPAGTNPAFLAVGDFNQDGIQDLATANYLSNNVTVLLGNGLGGFTAASSSPFPVGANPIGVAVADFNADGFQDLAIANNAGLSVTVLLGNGSGGFTADPGSPFPVGTFPDAVAVGDFNVDGIPDLATANYTNNNVAVLLGGKSGEFTAATGSPFTVGVLDGFVAVGDFNGDGFPDLATANFGINNVSVLLGNGQGGFAPTNYQFVAGTNPSAVVVGDFNGDGIQDLATANYTGNNVTVLLGGKTPTSSVLSTTSPLTIAQGQSVTLTLTVSATTTAFNTPTGTAEFLDGTTVLGTASQTASPYSFQASSLGVGSHTVTATYSGDTFTSGSSSNSITIQVNQTGRSLCDVNLDGVTNVTDVQLMIGEALGKAAAGNDLNENGVVNVVDVRIVINAVLGLGCEAE